MSILVEGWTGKLQKFFKDKVGIISAKIDGFDSQVYFDTSSLIVNGNRCSERGHLHSYLKLGALLHFNAEKLRKPAYDIGVHVWYKADIVWVGVKPPEAALSDTSSQYDETITVDDADVFGHHGVVAKIVNKSTAVLNTKIDNKDCLVAIERSRIYLNGKQCSGNIAKQIKLGDIVHFEAFQLKPKHPSGVEYRASAVWTVFRPNLDFKQPLNPLNLPDELLYPPPTPVIVTPGPSGTQVTKKDKSTSTRTSGLLAHASTSTEQNCRGLSGYVVCLPNKSTAVIKTEIDGRHALVALERCRFFIHNRACPEDISKMLTIGVAVRFEAFHIGSCHPCGVEFRTSLAWLGPCPNLTLPHPSHPLDLPQELTINLRDSLVAGLLK